MEYNHDIYNMGEEAMEPSLEIRAVSQIQDQGNVYLHDPMVYRVVPIDEAYASSNTIESIEEGIGVNFPGRTPRITSLPTSQSTMFNPYKDDASTSYLSSYSLNRSRSQEDVLPSYSNHFSPSVPNSLRHFSPSSQDGRDQYIPDPIPYIPVNKNRPYSIPLSTNISDHPFQVQDGSDFLPIFHSSRNRRGGIRLSGGSIQDISKLLMSSPDTLPPRPYSISYRSDDEVSTHYYPPRYSLTAAMDRPDRSIPYEPGIPLGEKQEVDSCLAICETLLHYLLRVSKQFTFDTLTIQMICSTTELNPAAPPTAKLCYDFLNFGHCKRERITGVCKYRHLAPDHIDTVMDKIFSGKMRISLIRQEKEHYYIVDLPGYDSHHPGELNPNVPATAGLCIEYNLNGRCLDEANGRPCRLRHLALCHPERIALLYLHGKLSEEEAAVWHLSPCSKNEVNPFSSPQEKLCYDFQNHGFCKRNQEGKICRFRHLLQEHADAVRDRRRMSVRNKGGKL